MSAEDYMKWIIKQSPHYKPSRREIKLLFPSPLSLKDALLKVVIVWLDK